MFYEERKKITTCRAAHTNAQIECIILVERQLKQISYYRIPICCVSDFGGIYIYCGALPKQIQVLAIHSSLTNNQKPYFQMKCPLNTVIIVECESLFSVSLLFRYTWLQPIRDHSRIWLVYIMRFFRLVTFLLLNCCYCCWWRWSSSHLIGFGFERRKKNHKHRSSDGLCAFFSSIFDLLNIWLNWLIEWRTNMLWVSL